LNKHKSFLISGSGRTGTRFLSNLMNLSEKWTVLHEPHPKRTINNTLEKIGDIQPLFEKDYYGEVNSMRRKILLDLDVDKKGVMVRNPFEIWLSIANRKLVERRKFNVNSGRIRLGTRVVKKIDNPDKWLDELKESLEITDKAIEAGIMPVYFHRMTKCVDYTKKILKHFGIEDIDVTHKLITTPVNSTPINKKYNTINDINCDTSELYDICDQFYQKHLAGKI